MKEEKLTPKYKIVADNYLTNNFNKKQAVIDAGYSKKTAKQQATIIFTNVYLVDYLKKRITEMLDNREELQMKWIRNITEMAFYELTGDPETDKYRAGDKTKALELLGKYLTLFTEKKDIKIEGEIGVRIIDDIK